MFQIDINKLYLNKYIIFHTSVQNTSEKNGFAERSKILAGYR